MTGARFYDWIAYHARRTPDRLALVDDHSGRRLPYSAVDRRVSGIAGLIGDALGLMPGDRVAVLAHNSTNLFELQFACARAAAIFVPLNTRLAAPEIASILDDCRPGVLFHDREFAALAQQLAAERPLKLVLLDETTGDSICEGAVHDATRGFSPRPVLLDDTWSLIYTSGTTGVPKGVKISYGMTLFNALNYSSASHLGSSSNGLVVLPMFHTSGLNLPGNPCLYHGACVTVMRRFAPDRALELLTDRGSGITHIFGVPANFLLIRQLAEFEHADLSRLVSVGIAGAPAPLALLEEYLRKGVGFQQGFGMTETGPLITLLGSDHALEKVGSSGTPLLHCEIRICDDAGEEVRRGEVGEICVRGPSVTRGYWNRTAETEAAFRDGWFRSGDAAKLDEQGFLYVIDRYKNMYISGGENIYPAEVENVLNEHDGISEAAVIGVPDEKWGEVGCAFVVSRAALSEKEVLAFCAERIARYKVPKRVVFVDAIPKNAVGKVDRRALVACRNDP